MDHNDKQAIDGVFNRLAQVGQQGGPRDAEAEAFIQQRMNAQDGSAYYLAQTVVVQDHALNAAQQRIEELEHQLRNRPAQSGGFMSRLFGGAPAQPAARPAPQPQPQAAMGQRPTSSPFGQRPGGPFGQQQAAAPQGGGFLAGAAQTAVGVAGGMLLGNMIGSMLAGDAAEAAPVAPVAAEPHEEPEVEEEAYVADEADYGDDSEW